jgi:glyoxylase-like metal-dependent hydrolase (beta-lactamase superfamily II)
MSSIFRFSSLINNINIRTMKIRYFNALQDNYMYLITDDKTNECAVVDPAQPEEVRT